MAECCLCAVVLLIAAVCCSAVSGMCVCAVRVCQYVCGVYAVRLQARSGCLTFQCFVFSLLFPLLERQLPHTQTITVPSLTRADSRLSPTAAGHIQRSSSSNATHACTQSDPPQPAATVHSLPSAAALMSHCVRVVERAATQHNTTYPAQHTNTNWRELSQRSLHHHSSALHDRIYHRHHGYQQVDVARAESGQAEEEEEKAEGAMHSNVRPWSMDVCAAINILNRTYLSAVESLTECLKRARRTNTATA